MSPPSGSCGVMGCPHAAQSEIADPAFPDRMLNVCRYHANTVATRTNYFDQPRHNTLNIMAEQRHEANMQDAQKLAERQQQERESLLRRIENDFRYHAPTPGQVERYALVRDTALRLARVMVENAPPSRELASALTRLEEAVMHANAAIARNEH